MGMRGSKAGMRNYNAQYDRDWYDAMNTRHVISKKNSGIRFVDMFEFRDSKFGAKLRSFYQGWDMKRRMKGGYRPQYYPTQEEIKKEKALWNEWLPKWRVSKHMEWLKKNDPGKYVQEE